MSSGLLTVYVFTCTKWCYVIGRMHQPGDSSAVLPGYCAAIARWELERLCRTVEL